MVVGKHAAGDGCGKVFLFKANTGRGTPRGHGEDAASAGAHPKLGHGQITAIGMRPIQQQSAETSVLQRHGACHGVPISKIRSLLQYHPAQK